MLAQSFPNLEALIKESEEKIIDLNQNHAEITHLESFTSKELATLAEHFHYVKEEYMYLWNQMNGYYTILEDSEGAAKHKEQLIA